MRYYKSSHIRQWCTCGNSSVIFWCKVEGTDERERNCYGGLEYNWRERVSPERPACSRRIQPNKINKSDVFFRLNFHSPPQNNGTTNIQENKAEKAKEVTWQVTGTHVLSSFFHIFEQSNKNYSYLLHVGWAFNYIDHFTESTHLPNINSLQTDDSSSSKLPRFRNPKTFIEKGCR